MRHTYCITGTECEIAEKQHVQECCTSVHLAALIPNRIIDVLPSYIAVHLFAFMCMSMKDFPVLVAPVGEEAAAQELLG